MKKAGIQYFLHICSCLLFLLFAQQATAQFTITNDFKGNGSPDIIIGNNAYLTSGVDDPVNAGWLRLTKAQGNQKGYAYINKSFPSTLGVLVDFEYTMWRTMTNAPYYGADGFSIFLFDASYGPGNFALGAYGGSLGYANSTASSPATAGLTGGYIGIGFDAYGNFVRSSEGKNGGSSNVSPNSIALRGKTTSTSASDTNTNKYLDGVTLFPDGSTADALLMSGNAQENVVDYNTPTSVRPSYGTFYRRVQVEVTPTGTGLYTIQVRWAKSQGGSFTQLLEYTTPDAPPNLLKLGFAASTGGGYNYHEIRNILVTTPGNLRVSKLANKDVLRSVAGSGSENRVTYKLEVVNDTPADLANIEVEDQLTDGEGVPIPAGMFRITGISADSNFIPGSVNLPDPTTSSPINSGNFSGVVGLPANTTGIITVTGYLDAQIPKGNLLQNTVTVRDDEITDQDLENNTSTVRTPVLAEKVDLVVHKTVDEYCLDATNGNAFTVTVANMGTLPAEYNTTSKIRVTETIPAGATMSGLSYPGWEMTQSGNVYTFTKTGSGSLGSGISLSPIKYTITRSSGYVNTAEVAFVNNSTGVVLEPVENRNNNTAEVEINSRPQAPVVSSPVYYCQGEVADPLTAGVVSGNRIYWYTAVGSAPLNNAPVPNTSSPGTVTYYVSQSDGGCESELAAIEVVVLPTPQAGSITGGEEICRNTRPGPIAGSASGTGFGTVSYRWEKADENDDNWEEIATANGATYQPDAVTDNTKYRRITVATNSAGYSCESVPTNEILITTRRCMVITNPMLPSKAKQ
ncbi:hypothetical protein SAMN02927921_02631 [Sinomicrobium oceani]|uniref:Ig-like domain-containing protein n=1 Tax=Sinomicrobium oceani TaxID=1150368 RepID=A0A1K1QJF3_9FLAO|nr:hypothetical protein [Sinomicrobium oceani]SFW59901.1 hypothetical protein SAMN02927921_02631 [Sinomicrobium oceani]